MKKVKIGELPEEAKILFSPNELEEYIKNESVNLLSQFIIDFEKMAQANLSPDYSKAFNKCVNAVIKNKEFVEASDELIWELPEED